MLGQMVNVTACPRCRGEGKIVELPCDTCQGDGRIERRRTLRVTIPPGIDDGHQIRLSNEGEAGPRGGPKGSLYVAVHVQPHPALRREGTELFYEPRVSIVQAALGTRVTVPTVEGDEEIEIKAGTQPGTEIRLRGRGVPHLRRTGSRGDLHVLVDVVVPTQLSKKAARAPGGLCRRSRARPSNRTAAGSARSSGSVERPGRRNRHRGAWLELAVEADLEAVEAVSEILGRVAPGGTSVEPGVRADRRGPGRPDRPDATGHRPRLRPGPRSRRRGARRSTRWTRRSGTSRRSSSARSASSGPGWSTRPTGPTPGRRISRCSASAGGW